MLLAPLFCLAIAGCLVLPAGCLALPSCRCARLQLLCCAVAAAMSGCRRCCWCVVPGACKNAAAAVFRPRLFPFLWVQLFLTVSSLLTLGRYMKEGMTVGVLLWNGKVRWLVTCCARGRCHGGAGQELSSNPAHKTHSHRPCFMRVYRGCALAS